MQMILNYIFLFRAVLLIQHLPSYLLPLIKFSPGSVRISFLLILLKLNICSLVLLNSALKLSILQFIFNILHFVLLLQLVTLVLFLILALTSKITSLQSVALLSFTSAKYDK